VSPFGTGFHGGTLGDFPFVPFDFLKSHSADLFSQELTGVGSFIPICQRNGQLGSTPVELDNSCFTPDEVADVQEKTNAVYAMVKFGGPNAMIGNMPISGNFGLRYVETKDVSNGFVRYATIPGLDATLCPRVAAVPGGIVGGKPIPGDPGFVVPPTGGAYYPTFCYLSPSDQAYATGGGTATTATNKLHHFLPSFNLRLDITPKWLIRFAVSKALSRPDIGLLKNFTAVSMGLPTGDQLGDPRWTIGPDGQPTGVTPYYTASAFNPYLKPTTAWQYDVSLENYFGNVGQFSIAGFYKTFSDYIQYGSFEIPITNNGETKTVTVRGPANGKGAKIRGFEFAYQRFFDFLPKPFDGFGIQTNFTYVKNSGVPNSNLSIVGSTGETTNAGNNHSALNPNALEGLSKYSYNVVAMYEKGKLSARLAYNHRSKYLVTTVDCCVYLPVWQKGAGYLDGSIRYRLTDGIEMSVEGSNLLNTKTVLYQQVTDADSPEGKIVLTPNGWFQNDRRFIVGIRWKMGK
jgi:TonB-dependent receptor